MNLSPAKRACALGLTAVTLVTGLSLSATPAFADAPSSSFGAAAQTSDIGTSSLNLVDTYDVGAETADVATSRDGRFVYTANGSKSVSVMTVATGRVKTYSINAAAHTIEAGVDGFAYVGTDTGLIKLDPASGLSAPMAGPAGLVGQLSTSSNGRYMVGAVGGNDRGAAVWDLEAGTYKLIPLDSLIYVHNLSVSPDGTRIVGGVSHAQTGRAYTILYDTATLTEVKNFGNLNQYAGTIWSPDSASFYFADNHQWLTKMDIASGETTRISGPDVTLKHAVLSPDGQLLYTPSSRYNEFMVTFDLAAGTSETTAVPGYPKGIAVSQDGRAVYVASGAGNLLQFNEDAAVQPAAVDVQLPVDGSTVTTDKPVFSGVGEPGAMIVLADAAGASIASTTVGTDGSWSIASTVALPAGANSISATQTVDGKTTTDSTSFTIDTAVPAPFEVAVAGNVVSGKGVDGATINIVDKDGKNVGTTTVADGVWSITVAPFGTGKHPINVTQTVGGVASTPVAAEIDFGAAKPLILEKPLDGSTVMAPDNLVPFSGTGQPGASVVITNGVGRKVVDTTVGADGKWAQTGFLGHQFYELDTSYMPKGEATVLGKTTVTVKASAGVVQPFSVSAPVENSTVVAPDNMVTFAGKGTTGAHIVIKNQVGRAVVDTIVDDLGNWSAKGFLGFQWYELDTFSTVNGATEIGKLHVTVKASAGVTQPFSLDTPADNATVIAPNNLVTFSGKGTTGATVSFKAQNGREIFSTKVDEKGNWTAAGGLGFQWYELNTSYTAPGAAPVAGKTHLTVSSGKVINAFEMTAPKDGDTVVTPNGQVSFTGKGAAGATVKIINDLGGQWERIVATAVVKDDGTWTATGGLNPNLTYPLWFAHTPGSAGGVQADGAFTITTSQQ